MPPRGSRKGPCMAAPIPARRSARASAIPAALINVCFVLFVINVSLFPGGVFLALVDLRSGRARHSRPTSSTSGRRAGWCSRAIRRRPMTGTSRSRSSSRCCGQDFPGYFAWHYPPPFLFVASLLAQFPYAVAFIGWVVGQPRALSCRDARDRRPRRSAGCWRSAFRWCSTIRWSGRTAFSPRR